MKAAYEKGSDVLGIVGKVLTSLEGTVRENLSTSYEQVINSVFYTTANDLLEILDMYSVCYPPGILSVADSYEGDLPSTMAPFLLIQILESSGSNEVYDSSVVESNTSEALGVPVFF